MKKIAISAASLLFGMTAYMSPASAHPVHHGFRALAVPVASWESVKDHIAACESGGRYNARSRRSTASGKYQFLNTTWAGRFGVRAAYLATPEQQEQAAAELHAKSGLRPWSASLHCWIRRIGR